ncbi:MAG: hypothetical protein KIS96_07420 [Bauldia sp.]|nr:hypothetical protein [Bauldia sp.]
MTRNSTLSLVTAGAAGLIFGIGLAIAQMTDPQKVKAFLDVATIADGTWDPSLAFVMGVGLLVTIAMYRLARPLPKPWVGAAFAPAPKPKVDSPLVIGSAVFGIGWGLAGLCPGPAIADLGLAPGEVALFVVAMLAGSWGAGLTLANRGRSSTLPHGNAATT